MTDPEDGDHTPGRRHQGPAHASPYPTSRLSPAFGLTDLAREVEAADGMVSSRAEGKLRVIVDQIRSLQAQARQVLEEMQQEKALHRAQCRFQRIPGRVYHLYRHADGGLHFSMLSPEDWGGSPPHPFVGSYRLEPDMSWTPADQLHRPDPTGDLVRRLMEDPAHVRLEVRGDSE